GTDAHSPPSKADSSAEGTSQGKGKTLRDSKKKPEENKEKCSEDETDHDKVFDCLQKQEDLANAGTGVNQPDGSEKYDGKARNQTSNENDGQRQRQSDSDGSAAGCEATTVDSTTDATQPDKSNQAGYNPKDVNPVASTNEDEAKEKPNQENEQKEGAKAADTAGKDVSSVKQPNTEKSSPCSGISDDEYDTGRCGFTLFDKSSPQCPNGPDSTSPGNSAGGVGSTQIQNPGSSGPGSTAVSGDGSSHTGTRGGQQGDSASSSSNFGLPNFDLANMIPKGPNVPGGGFVPLKREHVTLNEDNEKLMKQGPPSHGGPDGPDLTADVLTATTPVLFFLSAVTVALLGYSLWKHFAYVAKRRRTFRTVRDVPSPPLDEEILEHLQRGELTPRDYGYTLVRDTQPASTSGRGRSPRVHKRTLIELHLEVLHEREAASWENVKDDYLQIVVQQFAQDLMRCGQGYSSSTVCAAHLDSPNDDATTQCPPTNSDGPDACPLHDPDAWSCMDSIQFATDPSASNEEDRWHCMETIQLDDEQHGYSDHGDATSYCAQWIPWIEQHKHILRDCTTQPWFLQLKSEWKQYLREHMAANADHGHTALGERRNIPSTARKKRRLWKEWVAQQHRQMCMYNAQEWCQHLLNSVEQAAVSHNGQAPRVDAALAVDKVMGTADVLRVRDVPRSQPLHRQPYMKKRATAQTWILILALVIEQCEVECRLQEREYYVDDLLEQL
ncbi:hypothetical protein AK88_05185, partial [Plasmodium fragile]